MRTLREQVELDRRVFLNPQEFGEKMRVDGLPCVGSWDEETDQSVKQFFGSKSMEDATGVFTRERILFVMREDGARMRTPAPGQDLDIDGVSWTVQDASPEGGIMQLTLYRNEA